MKIFINYRRDDSAGYAINLYGYLSNHFGEDNIFMDINKIEPGDDFRRALANEVSTCDVVLVMIGRQWLNIKDGRGQRRLENPGDWVRVEIASALANPHVRVVPVLVQGANVPGTDELPDDLKELAWRHASELSDSRFPYDANRLIRKIEEVIGKPKRSQGSNLFKRFWGIGLGMIILLLVGLAARYMLVTRQQLRYNVRNQLAQSITVYANDDFEGIVPPGKTRSFTRLSRADFPLSIRWEIKKIGSFGDDMSETIRQVDPLQTVTVDNKIGPSIYFHPVISSRLKQQCRISINDATKIEAPAGFINPDSKNVSPGYFLWRDDSNVTLYCNNEPMWYGIRRGNDSRRFDSIPEAGDGDLAMTFYARSSSP